ncbi:methyltransferase domain-containing protein [Vallitalea pronyensis]|uniref:Methyltransferase domain-containing protein n=1 Tax=Vallitalea pronyensis TaxID=1348613 RepID=A0A8J8SFW7_9FIRM|nr:class I SAM-dependent methyltransferase [Vallitalea pronyensis]QUI21673.1 methyltransferase domain-containing protein [Vallitalea pronyensis]
MKNISNEWDNASKEWIDCVEINHYRKNILIPETLKMLGKVKGKKLIDIGCGEGGYSRLLAEKGACVVGVDYSQELINEAIKRKATYDIQYYVKDACYLEGIENEYFDLAISTMCLIAFEDLQSAMKELYRVLKPGGECVISILHPCFTREDYFSEGAYTESLSQFFGKPITFWHKTLSKTINYMIKAGFKLELLSEPILDNKNTNRKDDKFSTPMFLLVKLKK